MLSSPFAFFRGGAAIMAADLADTPVSGLRVQLCGDAHLSNFGGFAAPDRDLVFDLNDFDETLPGPWEWDLKRLAASVAVAGRELGLSEARATRGVLATVQEYRLAMRDFAQMRTLDLWYSRLGVDDLFQRWTKKANVLRRKGLAREIAKARTKDSLRAFAKLTHEVDGQPRIVSDPPLIVPWRRWSRRRTENASRRILEGVLRDYRAHAAGSPPPPARLLTAGAHRPQGRGRRERGHARLDRAAAGPRWPAIPSSCRSSRSAPSVLEPFAGPSRFRTHGQRVVEGQRLMQAASDVFLGWLRVEEGIQGGTQDYYVRQLWDQKASVKIESLGPRQLAEYGRVCGWTLARAHARSGDRFAIAGYLGGGDRFDRATADFAELYADQNERDYAALAAAVEAGQGRRRDRHLS